MTARQPHVVIVGGGFGGLNVARALRKEPVDITVIDRRNHHLFQPLLYQVATAGLSPADIAAPIRHVLRRDPAARVMLAEVVSVDADARYVLLSNGRHVAYDYLVLAAGADDQYFGNDEWARYAPGLKTIEDATEIRRRFLLAFEAAEQEDDPERLTELRTFIVVGGGPTGVEMAGSFAEVADHTLARDFRNIDSSAARIILLEGGDRLLSSYPEDLSEAARVALERLGVEVHLNSIVTKITENAVYVGDERYPARNVVWAAGVRASPLGEGLGVEQDRMGRVIVEPDLSVPGRPEIFVIGDMSSYSHQTGKPLPGVAPVAMQQGNAVADNIMASVRGEARKQFKYNDKGSMATIGRAAAVAQIGRVKLTGLPAWLTWLFVHILFLIGFRNRLVVFIQWAWSYLTWQRGARLITGSVGPDLQPTGRSDPAEPDGGGGFMEGDPAQKAARVD